MPEARVAVAVVIGVALLSCAVHLCGCASTQRVYRACVETCAAARCTAVERERLCAATRRLP